MVSKDKCLDLSVIPQFAGTCWFNAILTVVLYSQNVRKVMLKTSKTWSKSNSFFMIMKSILLKYYNEPEKVQQFFNKIKPEIILFKMLKTFHDEVLIRALKQSLKKDISNLAWYFDFIIKFFKFLNVNTLDIVYVNGKYYLNTDNEYTIKYNDVTHDVYDDIKDINEYHNSFKLDKKRTEVFQETSNILKKVPDIITVKHENLYKIEREGIYLYDFIAKKVQGFDSSSYDFDIKGLATHDDFIYLNGHTYKLDAVLLENYDINSGVGHAIAGITCNDNRYVYNGWNAESTDPAMQNKNQQASPCSLMSYDWDLKKDDSFCLNANTCKLDFFNPNIQKKDLCFSFEKGNRILIYVRVDGTNESSLSYGSIPSTIQLSGVSEVIKDIHIKDLTNEELVKKLNEFNVFLVPGQKYSRAVLENLYYDYLKKHYGVESNIRQTPIKIKKTLKSVKSTTSITMESIKKLSLTELIKKLEEFNSDFKRENLENLYYNYLNPVVKTPKAPTPRAPTPRAPTPRPKTPRAQTPRAQLTVQDMINALNRNNIYLAPGYNYTPQMIAGLYQQYVINRGRRGGNKKNYKPIIIS